jgi:hypothetical protein
LEWGRASRQLPAKRSGLGTTDSAVATGRGWIRGSLGKALTCCLHTSPELPEFAVPGVRRSRGGAVAVRHTLEIPSVVRQGEDLRVASNGEVLEFEGRGRGGVLDDRGEDRPPCARAAPLNLDWIEFLGSGSLTGSFVASCSWGVVGWRLGEGVGWNEGKEPENPSIVYILQPIGSTCQ